MAGKLWITAEKVAEKRTVEREFAVHDVKLKRDNPCLVAIADRRSGRKQHWFIHCDDEVGAKMLVYFLKHVMPDKKLYNKFLANDLIICRGKTHIRIIQKHPLGDSGEALACYKAYATVVCKHRRCVVINPLTPAPGPLMHRMPASISNDWKCPSCGKDNFDYDYDFSEQEWSIKKVGKKITCTGGTGYFGTRSENALLKYNHFLNDGFSLDNVYQRSSPRNNYICTTNYLKSQPLTTTQFKDAVKMFETQTDAKLSWADCLKPAKDAEGTQRRLGYRDPPVLVRLLQEIREANRR